MGGDPRVALGRGTASPLRDGVAQGHALSFFAIIAIRSFFLTFASISNLRYIFVAPRFRHLTTLKSILRVFFMKNVCFHAKISIARPLSSFGSGMFETVSEKEIIRIRMKAIVERRKKEGKPV